jgi:hypothetical protein
MAIGLLIRTGCTEIQSSHGKTRQETLQVIISIKKEIALKKMVFGRLDKYFYWQKVRRRQDEELLSSMSSQVQDYGGHPTNCQIINRGTKKEDDKIETKGEGQNCPLQLQKMIVI